MGMLQDFSRPACGLKGHVSGGEDAGTCQLASPEASISNWQGFRAMNLRVPVQVGNHELMATPDTGHGGIFQLASLLVEKFALEANGALTSSQARLSSSFVSCCA